MWNQIDWDPNPSSTCYSVLPWAICISSQNNLFTNLSARIIQLTFEQLGGWGVNTPTQSEIQVQCLTAPNLPTKSLLLLSGSLTDNLNDQFAMILFVVCIIYYILTLEQAREKQMLSQK